MKRHNLPIHLMYFAINYNIRYASIVILPDDNIKLIYLDVKLIHIIIVN